MGKGEDWKTGGWEEGKSGSIGVSERGRNGEMGGREDDRGTADRHHHVAALLTKTSIWSRSCTPHSDMRVFACL